MISNDYLDLKKTFSPEVLWRILPNRLLGKIESKVNDKLAFIKSEIQVVYPDGKIMGDIASYDSQKFKEGNLVMFSMKDAKESFKQSKGIKYLQEAYNVEYATDEDFESFRNNANYLSLTSLVKRLEELMKENEAEKTRLQLENKNLTAEVEARVNAALLLKTEELAKYESILVQKDGLLTGREKNIEASVAEKVAEKKLELDKFEAQLKSHAAKIKGANEISEKRMQEVEGERKQLAADYVKFQELGGEQVVKIFSEEDQVDIKPFIDNPYTQNLHKGILPYFEEQGYSINEAVSTQFFLSTLCAAISGQFVVLSGSTGVGKTSMVNIFASALGAGHGVIPVRPSWIDPTDLLGFYNPQLNRYQASPFMDCFLDAGKYSEANRMYFLTLDEMNLSRIENYAADFLSRFEKARAGEKDATLQLYSKDIYLQLKKDFEREMIATEKDPSVLRLKGNHLDKYPASKAIPEGLVMFGTINLDDTTHHLSPKFLDRSFIINVPAQELTDQISKISNASAQGQAFFEMSLNSVKGLINGNENLSPDAQKIWEDILGWQEDYIQPLGIRLGFRFSQMYVNFMKIAEKFNVAPHAAASVFLQSKLLPWISFHRDDKAIGNSNQTKLEIIESWAEDDNISNYPEEYGLQSSLQRIWEHRSDSIVVRYLE